MLTSFACTLLAQCKVVTLSKQNVKEFMYFSEFKKTFWSESNDSYFSKRDLPICRLFSFLSSFSDLETLCASAKVGNKNMICLSN